MLRTGHVAFLDLDLRPVGWVVACAVLVIVGLRMIERHAERRALLRTRRALQRALEDPTDG